MKALKNILPNWMCVGCFYSGCQGREKLSLLPASRSPTDDTDFPPSYQPGDPLSTRRPAERPTNPLPTPRRG
ncbi:unnamed protein product [Lota lota]